MLKTESFQENAMETVGNSAVQSFLLAVPKQTNIVFLGTAGPRINCASEPVIYNHNVMWEKWGG